MDAQQQKCRHDWVLSQYTFAVECRFCHSMYAATSQDVIEDLLRGGSKPETPQEAYDRAMKGI